MENDCRQFNSWYCEAIGDCRTQRPSARHVGDTDKWSQISQCHTIHDFVGQQSGLVLCALCYRLMSVVKKFRAGLCAAAVCHVCCLPLVVECVNLEQ